MRNSNIELLRIVSMVLIAMFLSACTARGRKVAHLPPTPP